MIASRNPPPHVGGYGLFRASNGPWRPAEVGADAAVSEVVESWLRMLVVEGFGVSLLFLLGNAFRWWSELAPSHSPVREKLLRSPGESLRRNLDELRKLKKDRPPLYGLMHYERCRLLFQPLAAFKPEPDYLPISKENVNKAALLKALRFT